MATVERPEVEIVSGEAPAVAGAGEVNEVAGGIPSPKASGPAGPRATPSTVVGGGDPNMNGHTVNGPLMVDVDLLEVPLDNLLALGMGSAEPSDDLVSNTCFEVSKAESERWRQAAYGAQEIVYAIQSEMDQVTRIHSETPGTELDETRLPDENGPRSGMSYRELGIRRHAMVVRQQQLRAGASFWAYVYFQGLVQPQTSDFTPISSLPEAARGTALASADYLHDMLRWCLGRFSKLQDLYAHMSEFMTQLQETDASSKKQFNVLAEKIHELAGAIVGVQSATRVAVDDSKQNQKQTHRTLENMLWQLAGPGKAVNQSMKDVVVSSAKMIQQVEQHLSKNIRIAESTAENMENMENHLAAISGHLQKLVELQSKSTKTEDPKASAKLPPPPIAPAGMNVPPQVAPASMTVPQATLGTAAHPVQPKLMPSNLTPPMPSGFPPAPPFAPQSYAPAVAPAAYTTPSTPGAAVGSSGSGAPPTSFWKRVRLADGSWNWAETDPSDLI